MRSKKGAIGEGSLYLIFFLIMAIIAIGVYGSLILYFGEGYDFRLKEAHSIQEETVLCFQKEGLFDINYKMEPTEFFEKCGFSSKILEDGHHFVYMTNGKGGELSIGVTDFKTRCFLNGAFKNRDLPLCTEYKVDDVYLLIGSSQNSKKVVAWVEKDKYLAQ